MNTEHEELYTDAEAAIRKVHADQSVGLLETLGSLRSLRNSINELIEAVECDIENAE